MEEKTIVYAVEGLTKFSAEDVYNEGEIPGTETVFSVDSTFKGSTPGEVVDKLIDFVGADDESVIRNSCDEMGRIDITVMETESGWPATNSQIESWKAGTMRLWSVCYSGKVLKMTIEEVEL